MLIEDRVNYTASWTQICNRALGRLGSQSITDLSEVTTNAEFCKLFLPEAIEYVLGQWDFKFAIKRLRLALNEDIPIFGWKYQFNLPKDYIRIIDVIAGSSLAPQRSNLIPFQIENGKVLSNEDTVQIVYIARPDNPNGLPQAVRKAISTHLAYLLATPLTSNDQLIALIAAESQVALEQAKKEDAQMNYDPYAYGHDFHTENRR
jgi:hypothetical protein